MLGGICLIDIAVIILGYHNLKELKEGLIEKINKQFSDNKSKLQYKIVYVDNYSCDGSIKYLKSKKYDIDVLMCTRNLMYEESNNLGIQFANKKYNPCYYLLYDADNMVRENTIVKLVDYMNSHKEVGIVQPKVLMYDNFSIYSMGHYFNEEGKCRLIRENTNQFDFNDLESCSILCTLFRKEVFKKCGLLNPVYEIYYESSDIAYRAKRAGYKVACCMDAIAYNDGSNVKSIENYHARYYMDRNRLIFWYIHDKDKFEHFKSIAEKKRNRLKRKIDHTPFGISDVNLLAEYNAIVDAIRITTNNKNIDQIVSLDQYDKYKVVVFRGDEIV